MPRRDDWDSDWGSWKLRHGLGGVEGKAPGAAGPRTHRCTQVQPPPGQTDRHSPRRSPGGTVPLYCCGQRREEYSLWALVCGYCEANSGNIWESIYMERNFHYVLNK